MATNQPGTLDTSYGTNGELTTPISAAFNVSGVPRNTIVQPDGKLLTFSTGQTKDPTEIIPRQIYVLQRFNTNGTLDTTFGSGGSVQGAGASVLALVTGAIRLQSDGSILVTEDAMPTNLAVPGIAKSKISKYTSSGAVDTAFGNNGVLNSVSDFNTSKSRSIAVNGDKIVVTGLVNGTTSVELYDSQGKPVTSFGTNGVVNNIPGSGGASGSLIQPDGKLVLLSPSTASGLVRLNGDGTVDNTFRPATGSPTQIQQQSNGKLLIVSAGDIIRLNADGSVDSTFTTISKSFSTVVVAVQSDDKILAGTLSPNGNFVVNRFNSGGSIDTTFGNNGSAQVPVEKSTLITNLQVTPNGRIYASGNNGTNFSTGSFFTGALSTANNLPVVANPIADQQATIGTSFNFAVPTNAFNDPDPGDTLTYTVSLADSNSLPSWLYFNPNTNTFTGTPPTGASDLTLRVKATDKGGLSVTDDFKLSISGGGTGGTGGTGGNGGTAPIIIPGLTLDRNLFQTDATFKGLGITPVSQKSTQKVSEIALFAVDDLSGKIGGIAPSDAGYLAAALANAKSIFSTLGGNFFSTDKRELALDPNKIYQALEIVDGSLLDAQQQLKDGKTPNNLLFSIPDANGNSPIKITNTANGYNLSINNDELVLAIDKLAGTVVNTPIGAKSQSSPQGRTIDLTDYAGQTLKADLVTKSSATYNNQIGFYAVEDAIGTIKLANGSTLKPGDANYASEAIKLALANPLQAGKTDSLTGKDIAGGKMYAPVVVAQGTMNDFLSKNPTNGGGANDIHAYFNYIGANTDKLDHFRLLGNNTFGVEDVYGGGDRDFNDLVIKMDLKV